MKKNILRLFTNNQNMEGFLASATYPGGVNPYNI
jgi:hypothetical protein